MLSLQKPAQMNSETYFSTFLTQMKTFSTFLLQLKATFLAQVKLKADFSTLLLQMKLEKTTFLVQNDLETNSASNEVGKDHFSSPK